MSLTDDQAKVLLNASFLPSLNAEHPVTKRVIAAIPADKIDYRPDDIVKSAIDLAWHIVTAENRFLEAVINGVFDLTPVARPDAGDVEASGHTARGNPVRARDSGHGPLRPMQTEPPAVVE